jgi:hypothetical protein
MSRRLFEVCCATPFGPHVVAVVPTQREAQRIAFVHQSQSVARYFVRQAETS